MKRTLLATVLALLPLCADAQQINGGRPAYQVLNTQMNSAGVGNGADLTEDTLFTYTIAANQLANVGDRLHIVAAGIMVSSTDNKTARVKFGGQNAISLTTTSTTTVQWRIETDIVKTAASVQSSSALGTMSGIVAAQAVLGSAAWTVTDTAAIALLVTGQNTTNSTANTITCKYLTVDFIPASL